MPAVTLEHQIVGIKWLLNAVILFDRHLFLKKGVVVSNLDYPHPLYNPSFLSILSTTQYKQ